MVGMVWSLYQFTKVERCPFILLTFGRFFSILTLVVTGFLEFNLPDLSFDKNFRQISIPQSTKHINELSLFQHTVKVIRRVPGMQRLQLLASMAIYDSVNPEVGTGVQFRLV